MTSAPWLRARRDHLNLGRRLTTAATGDRQQMIGTQRLHGESPAARVGIHVCGAAQPDRRRIRLDLEPVQLERQTQPARFDARGNDVNPLAQRIRALRFQGQTLAPDQVFALATNSYRAAGGVGFAGASASHVIYEAAISNREVLAQFLRKGGQPQPEDTRPQWGFAPMIGTTVRFDSAPQAADHLAEVSHLRIEPIDLQETGFLSFRLWLG